MSFAKYRFQIAGLATFTVMSLVIITMLPKSSLWFEFPTKGSREILPSSESFPSWGVLRYARNSGDTPLTLACKTCAYVVPSGHLLKSGSGPEIDANDCVFRSNDSPTFGFKDDVGEKTTMRIVNFISLQLVRRRIQSQRPPDKFYRNMTYLFVGNVANTRSLTLMNEVQTQYPNVTFVVRERDFIKHTITTYEAEVDHEFFEKDIRITSGFYAVLLMRELCSEIITVYGMAYPNYCAKKSQDKVWYHYYDGKRLECEVYNRHAKTKRSTHRFLKEKLAFEAWRRTWKNLYFRNPSWSADPEV